MRPIPTTYSGIRFRSRLEADAAQLLTLIRADWIYEPESFLLTCGEHYRPDFWLPELATWFEVRGYESVRGRAQIAGFVDDIRRGRIRGAYCALNLNGASWNGRDESGGVAVVFWCEDCGKWGLGSEDQLRCRSCGRYRNRSSVWDLRIADGRVRLSDCVAPWLTPVEFSHHVGLAPRVAPTSCLASRTSLLSTVTTTGRSSALRAPATTSSATRRGSAHRWLHGSRSGTLARPMASLQRVEDVRRTLVAGQAGADSHGPNLRSQRSRPRSLKRNVPSLSRRVKGSSSAWR